MYFLVIYIYIYPIKDILNWIYTLFAGSEDIQKNQDIPIKPPITKTYDNLRENDTVVDCSIQLLNSSS